MSYNTLSIITTAGNNEELNKLENDFKSLLPMPQIRGIIHPFKGVVAQYDLKEFENEELSKNVIIISKNNPQKKIASIEVDCFGGKCTSEGKIYEDGSIIKEEESDHVAHIKLLKVLSENYKTWHFEPFTREYFTKKGGIWGQINDENFKLFAIGIYTAYKSNPEFRCEVTPNELILEKKGKFYLYLMEPSENCIKILGSVLNDSEKELDELRRILNEEILYTNSYVFIELLDKGEVIDLKGLENKEQTEVLYRFKTFNDRPFDFSGNTNADSTIAFNENKKSFWNRLKQIFKRH